jgi:hypothetical protein
MHTHLTNSKMKNDSKGVPLISNGMDVKNDNN